MLLMYYYVRDKSVTSSFCRTFFMLNFVAKSRVFLPSFFPSILSYLKYIIKCKRFAYIVLVTLEMITWMNERYQKC